MVVFLGKRASLRVMFIARVPDFLSEEMSVVTTFMKVPKLGYWPNKERSYYFRMIYS